MAYKAVANFFPTSTLAIPAGALHPPLRNSRREPPLRGVCLQLWWHGWGPQQVSFQSVPSAICRASLGVKSFQAQSSKSTSQLIIRSLKKKAEPIPKPTKIRKCSAFPSVSPVVCILFLWVSGSLLSKRVSTALFLRRSRSLISSCEVQDTRSQCLRLC